MARINLLPWRQEERERKNKEFNTLIAGTLVLAAICGFIAYSILNGALNSQRDANKKIEDANAQLDVALKSIEELEAQREQMLSQMKVIQDLQGRRSIPVRVWDDMARAVPTHMYLTNIKRENDLITITGQASNANVVAGLVRNLNASQWLDGSAVVSIKSKIQAYQDHAPTQVATNPNEPARPVYPEDSYVEFVVTTQVQQPKAEGEDGQIGGDQAIIMPATTMADTSQFDQSLAQPMGVEPVGSAPQEATAPVGTSDAMPQADSSQPISDASVGQVTPEPSNAPVGVQ
ncbi:MAG: PilN domain-containing protein [Moraxella sp.]|nr:PilN domain-containing protein [Moraxella sp.]